MSIGAKYRLFINPNLAYGEAGSGLIGPHEVLIFEVELLSFEN
jgi:FKBP-type peptidyl-prolyl cis-trans isomerase